MLARLILPLFILLLTACGGGHQSDVKTGVFLDSAVQGLHYQTQTLQGETNALGQFQYHEGEVIHFFIDDILIGTSRAKDIITPADFITPDSHKDTLSNLLRFIQTLDADDEPENGIQLSETSSRISVDSINFSQAANDFVNDNNVLIILAKYDKTQGLISAGTADVHFYHSLNAYDLLKKDDESIFQIGGSISGLSGSLVLENLGEFLTIQNTNTFEFQTALPTGSEYHISIKQQPSEQTCSVINGLGEIKGFDVSSITVVCQSLNNGISGSISGLAGDLILSNNNENIYLTTNGNFTVPGITEELVDQIIIGKQPDNQICELIKQSTGLQIECFSNIYTLSVEVSGISGELILKNVDGILLKIASNGIYSFEKKYSLGQEYEISVVSDPVGQTCNIPNSKGSVDKQTSLSVKCHTNHYDINFDITGAIGPLTFLVNKNGVYQDENDEYKISLAYNTPYSVVIDSMPETQKCSIDETDKSGTVLTDNISIPVKCDDKNYQYEVLLDNFYGNFELQNNGKFFTEISQQRTFIRANYGESYDFSIADIDQPFGHTCTVNTLKGIVESDTITIDISCEINKYDIFVTSKNLNTAIGLINTVTGDELDIISGSFNEYQFPSIFHGNNYEIVFAENTQTPGQICSLENASSIVNGADAYITLSCIDIDYFVDVNISGLNGDYKLDYVDDSHQLHEIILNALNPSHRISLLYNEQYTLSVNPPENQQCTDIDNSLLSSTGVKSNVLVKIDCQNLHSVSVNVIGLEPTNDNISKLSIAATGAFTENQSVTAQPDIDEAFTYTGKVIENGNLTLELTDPYAYDCWFSDTQDKSKIINLDSISSSQVISVSCDLERYTFSGSISWEKMSANDLSISNANLIKDNNNIIYAFSGNSEYIYSDTITFNIDKQPTTHQCLFDIAPIPSEQITVDFINETNSVNNINCAYKYDVKVTLTDNAVVPNGGITVSLGNNESSLLNNIGDEYTFSNSLLTYETPDIVINNSELCMYTDITGDLISKGFYHFQIDCTTPTSVSLEALQYYYPNGDVNFYNCLITDAAINGVKFTDITSINCNNLEIKSLEGVELFLNLEDISVNDNEIFDFYRLSELDRVKTINRDNNIYPYLSDIYPTQFSDTGLKECLKTLATDFPSLRTNQVKQIDCVSSKVKDISDIAIFESLITLNLYDNAIVDISPIKQLQINASLIPAKLQQLHLAKNKIVFLDGIQFVPSIKLLILNNNDIVDLSPLLSTYIIDNIDYFSLNNLVYLDLANNKYDLVDLELNNPDQYSLLNDFLATISNINIPGASVDIINNDPSVSGISNILDDGVKDLLADTSCIDNGYWAENNCEYYLTNDVSGLQSLIFSSFGATIKTVAKNIVFSVQLITPSGTVVNLIDNRSVQNSQTASTNIFLTNCNIKTTCLSKILGEPVSLLENDLWKLDVTFQRLAWPSVLQIEEISIRY